MTTTKSKHGTYARYVNQKCRCSRCRVANANYQRERRRKDLTAPVAHVTK